MDIKLHISIILGTAREGRESEKVAKFLLREAIAYGFDTEIVDVRDFLHGKTIPAWEEDERTASWKKIVTKSDGFVIVTPEYNHGYPGELKILLDSAYDEYKRKPVGLCGVSNGAWGGTRVVEHIRPVLVTLGLLPIVETLYFPNIKEAFNEDGSPIDSGAVGRAQNFFDALSWHAEALKNAK